MNSQIINIKDVYVISYEHVQFPIGRIKQNTLYLDSPSRHRISNSYGIDMSVLTEDHSMDYHYVVIKERGKDWTTSRKFWLRHGSVKDLNNGRTETFLPDELFGTDKATLYEEWLSPDVQALLKKDIFDVAKDNNWEELDKWESAIIIDEDYKNSLKYQRKITL